MPVVVVVVVDGELARHVFAEQGQVGGIPGHRLGTSGAADVVVEADHLVGRRHHQVQIVGNQKDATAPLVPDAPDQTVEVGLAAHVHALHRFVQHQQVGLTQKRPRQQDPLQLPARNVPKGAVQDLARAYLVKDGGPPRRPFPAAAANPKGQEPPHRQRQGGIQNQALGHVPDAESGPAEDAAALGPPQTQNHP